MEKNSLVNTFIAGIAILVLNVFTGIVTARVLGPSGKGMLRTLIIWPTIFANFSILGLHESLVYFFKKNELQKKAVYSTAFYFMLCSSVLFGVVFFAIHPILLKSSGVSHHAAFVIFIASYLPIYAMTQAGIALIQAKEQFIKYNVLRLLPPAGYLIFLLVFINNLTPTKCMKLLLISNYITVTIVLYTTSLPKINFLPLKEIKKILYYGIKAHLANFISGLNLQEDQAIISIIGLPSMLGLYSVASSAARIGHILPIAAGIVFFPKFSGQKKHVKKRSLHKNTRLILLFTIISALVFTILAKPIILFLFGDKFLPSVNISQILYLTSIPVTIIYMLSAAFKSEGMPEVVLFAEIFLMLGIALVGTYLYLSHGLLGLSLGVLISYTLSACYLLFMGKKKMGISFKKLIFPLKNDFAWLWKKHT